MHLCAEYVALLCAQNCMLGLDQDQVWIGSQDSIIYIIDTRSMSCNKQLTEHRHEVMDFALEESDKMR
jgi:hypothetical protein